MASFDECRAGDTYSSGGCAWTCVLVALVVAAAGFIMFLLFKPQYRDMRTGTIMVNPLRRYIDRSLVYPLIASFDGLIDRSPSLNPAHHRRRIPKVQTQDPVLPRELCDEIIFAARTDRQTLLSCSLVCKRWLPISRRHLIIELSSAARTRAFGNLLRSPHETMSPYIRDMSLHDSRGILNQHRRVLTMLQRRHTRIESVQITSSLYAELLRTFLPETRGLAVVNPTIPSLPREIFRNLFQLRQSNLLGKIAGLRALRVLDITVMTDPTWTEDISVPLLTNVKDLPPITSLTLNGWNTDLNVCLARNCDALESLCIVLSANFRPLFRVDVVEAFLLRNRDTIRHISLPILENAPVNLAMLRRVESVNLVASGAGSDASLFDTINSVSDCEALTSIVLERLDIAVTLTGVLLAPWRVTENGNTLYATKLSL